MLMAKAEPEKNDKNSKESDSKHTLHPDNLKAHGAKLAQHLADGSVVVGAGIVRGSQIVGSSAVAAAKSTKAGVEAGVSGFKKFLNKTAETLHLKKPDLRPLDQMEKEVSPYLPTEFAKRWYWKNVKLTPTVGKGNLVLNWTRIFCWHDDPFRDDLLYPIDDFFVLDKERKSVLNHFLVKGEAYGTITGDKGSGKTAFMHWITWELNAHHPEVVPCLIDCSEKKVNDTELIKQLMYPFLNIYQKTVSRPFEEMNAQELGTYIKSKVGEKPFVLLVDEPYNINEKGLEVLLTIQKTGIRFQLIIAGEKEEIKKSPLGKGLKDALKFELESLDLAQTALFLKKRIEAVGGEGTYPFDQQTLKMLRDHGRGNPLQVLELAKEKAIQLSIDHKEEIVEQQQTILKAREEAARKNAEEERQKKISEKEKLRQMREEDREKHLQALERQRFEEEKKHLEELRQEDMQLDKIDEVIGAIVSTPEKGTKQKGKEDTSEMQKQEDLVKSVVGHIPVEKNVGQVLAEDPSLANDLEQVFAETEKARKKSDDDKKAKKKR